VQSDNTKLHYLIVKQLKRSGLSEEDILEDKREHWRNFLSRINDCLENFEQERYLTERSMEISSREMREIEAQTQKFQQQLLAVSHQAGMAEIATSILHNIGNILNSASVSISIILDILRATNVQKLQKVSGIIQEHTTDDYLIKDPKGKQIPTYLLAIAKAITEEQEEMNKEVHNVELHLRHIKEIVVLQNKFSGISTIREKISIPEVIDLSLQLSTPNNAKVKIIKDYQFKGMLYSDKTKLLQILVNLVKNAKDAVMSMPDENKTVTISTRLIENEKKVEIKIQDNGNGIPQENLTRIFAFGYTTKIDGHGFGLHGSAIASKDLHGSLIAKSEGINKGAAFILELPLVVESEGIGAPHV
jgi:signal transduction histidine kinase